MSGRIYSMGHGARSIEEFLATLEQAGIEALVDIRTAPGSRKHPHFGRDALAEALGGKGIRYLHLKRLGGFRRALADSPNVALRSSAFRGYADHMASEEFAHAYRELVETATAETTACMCAETLWWRCHRRILSDRLAADGWEVLHLMKPGEILPHRPSPEARLQGGLLIYDGAAARLL